MVFEKKHYLGDGAYVALDGDCVALTTEDGIDTTNKVFLEREVLQEFLRYLTEHGLLFPERV